MNQSHTRRVEQELIEGEDFYWEGALMVLTARFHTKRGYCCGNGCRHCPYQSIAACEQLSAEEPVNSK